jgi:predicted RND superfamily exporter protein
MTTYSTYSTYNIVREYYNHKDLVDCYLKGDRTETMFSTKILEMTIELFVLVLAIVIIIWCISLYYLIRYWDRLPTWVRIISVLDLLFGFGIISLTCVLAVKDKA